MPVENSWCGVFFSIAIHRHDVSLSEDCCARTPGDFCVHASKFFLFTILSSCSVLVRITVWRVVHIFIREICEWERLRVHEAHFPLLQVLFLFPVLGARCGVPFPKPDVLSPSHLSAVTPHRRPHCWWTPTPVVRGATTATASAVRGTGMHSLHLPCNPRRPQDWRGREARRRILLQKSRILQNGKSRKGKATRWSSPRGLPNVCLVSHKRV